MSAPHRQRALEALVVFVAALAFYGATLAPTLIWGDSAWLVLNILRGSLHFGTASDHPLFELVGRAFAKLPGDPSRNINLEAAVFGALTVMLVYRCARQLGHLAARRWHRGRGAVCVSRLLAPLSGGRGVHSQRLLSRSHAERTPRLEASSAVALPLRCADGIGIGLTNHLVLASVAPAAVVFVVATNPRRFLSRWTVICGAALAVVAIALVVVAPPALTAAFRKLWVGPPSISQYSRAFSESGTDSARSGILPAVPAVSVPLSVVAAWIGGCLRDRAPHRPASGTTRTHHCGERHHFHPSNEVAESGHDKVRVLHR